LGGRPRWSRKTDHVRPERLESRVAAARASRASTLSLPLQTSGSAHGAHFGPLSIQTTIHPALIPHKVAGLPAAPADPRKRREKDLDLPSNPRRSPLGPQVPISACHAEGRGLAAL